MKRLGLGLFFITVLVAAGAVVFILSRIDVDKMFKSLQPEPGTNILVSFPFSSELELDEWQEKALAGKSTEFTFVEEDGKSCIKAVSEDSASTLYYRRQLPYSNDPYVSWDWKVSKFPSRKKKETLDKKSEFDFAAQVYVVFYAKFFLNAKAIQYVWTENLPVGESADSPYTKNVKLLVLESGPTAEWKHEDRNISEDFKELFGQDLKTDIEGIAFMTDADSTGSFAEAYFSNFEVGTLTTQTTGSSFKLNAVRVNLIGLFERYPFIREYLEKGLLFLKRGRAFLHKLIEKYFTGGESGHQILK